MVTCWYLTTSNPVDNGVLVGARSLGDDGPPPQRSNDFPDLHGANIVAFCHCVKPITGNSKAKCHKPISADG